ncbi:hypothetical protein GGX14DRAFT_381593, partial [Mycena pura]
MDTGIDILHRAVALDALHDSAERFPTPRCHPETRAKMLNDLWKWSTGPNPTHHILWLHGPAGAGKSALMQTLSQRLEDAGRLGGTFFFKRGHATRGNAKTLFATLAYRLALRIPQFKASISQTVEDDPSVVGSSMDIQLHRLIERPCQSVKHTEPPLLLIDGLDECEGHDVQQEILRILGNSFCGRSSAFKIIVSSRPEPHIREVF